MASSRDPSGRDFSASTSAGDSTFEASSLELALGRRLSPGRWLGWRQRLLLLAALAGSIGLFLLVGWLAREPQIDAQWQAAPFGRIELVHSELPALAPHHGRLLQGISTEAAPPVGIDALALHRSPRWLVDDRVRARHLHLHESLAALLQSPRLLLHFSDGSTVAVEPAPRGVGGLGSLFWLLAALALVLYIVAMAVVLARPGARNVVYALMALCQAANLLFIAVESVPGLGLMPRFMPVDLVARVSLDLFTAAALVHACAMHPLRLPGQAVVGTVAWISALGLALAAWQGQLQPLWWIVQAAVLGYGLCAVALLSLSYRREPNPFALVLRRFALVTLGTLLLLTWAVAAAHDRPRTSFNIAAVGSAIWYVFLAALLLLVPFLSRSRQLMREFVMLAGVSTVATSLDLLFVTVFSLGQFASLTLAVFLSLGVYAGARQWILNQMLGSRVPTTERMFDQLYRIARAVEARPERAPELLARLLRELFDPLECAPLARATSRPRVLRDGSTMLVPVPRLRKDDDGRPATLVLRFALRGQRLFTEDDARLADRVVEQLRRAVAYDQAVEHGRSEERARIAQDLHDDIGARLLTLMYQAPTPEMEDYLRHTLQDLKTLTRGLAAASHPLAHAAAEWKADIGQRLAAAQCELQWSFSSDQEVVLSVVEWSALTRILRELINNIISHAGASQVAVQLTFAQCRLHLSVCDDGRGRDPAAWSHGLGLGGVRKRVKQLGGQVQWRENAPRGICCAVTVPLARDTDD